MTREGSVRNRPTELVGRHMRLTREAQILLVAETMAQVRPLDEVPTTCVLGGVEAYASVSQKAWYHKELARALKVGRQAAKSKSQLEVLAAPERHTQPEQRHMGLFSKAPGPSARTFQLEHASPMYGDRPARTDLHAETWAELQRELHVFCEPAVVNGLDLAWVRPTPITKGEWTITELGQDGPHQQEEQQQAQAAAPILIAEIDPECDRCGALLDELGSCPRCTPLRISAATTDLAGLLRGNGWGEERRELATETADGVITLRALPGGDVRLEVDRYGAAVAAVTLTREARLALVTDLMQLDRAQAWGGQ